MPDENFLFESFHHFRPKISAAEPAEDCPELDRILDKAFARCDQSLLLEYLRQAPQGSRYLGTYDLPSALLLFCQLSEAFPLDAQYELLDAFGRVGHNSFSGLFDELHSTGLLMAPDERAALHIQCACRHGLDIRAMRIRDAPLCFALAVMGRWRLLNLLVDRLDFSQTDAIGQSPLFWSCRSNDPETIALLAELSPHPQTDLAGQSPAEFYQDLALRNLVRFNPSNLSALESACLRSQCQGSSAETPGESHAARRPL